MAELHHRVEFKIGILGIEETFTCVAPEGADCRLICGEDCGSETYPCYSWDEEGWRVHDLADSGYCNASLFIEDIGVVDSYEGTDAPLRDGLVEIAWGGDSYVWSYPDGGGSDG